MIFYNVLGCYMLILLLVVLTVTSQVTKRSRNSDDDVQNTFAKLLKSIVKVNEERMDAVKKITQLQDYMFTKNPLRADKDSYDTLEEEENHIFFNTGDSSSVRRTEDEIITRHLCTKLLLGNNINTLTDDVFKQMYPNKASGKCVSACMKSLVNVCENLNCDSGVKRNIRTECHDNCRSMFEK